MTKTWEWQSYTGDCLPVTLWTILVNKKESGFLKWNPSTEICLPSFIYIALCLDSKKETLYLKIHHVWNGLLTPFHQVKNGIIQNNLMESKLNFFNVSLSSNRIIIFLTHSLNSTKVHWAALLWRTFMKLRSTF